MTWSLGPGAIGAGRDLTIGGPVTIRVVQGSFDRLADAIFDVEELADQLDVARFQGRTDFIGKIDQYIATHDRGYTLIRGEAGVGKSALAAHLVWTRPCAYHFTRVGAGARIPVEARKNLAAQLIGAWDLAGQFAPDDTFPIGAARPDWLGKVLRAAARQRDTFSPGAPLVLVVDGLDEAEPDPPGMDTGVPLGLPAPDSLPPGVFVVATSRLGPPLDRFQDGSQGWFTLNVDDASNRQDMHDYLTRLLTGPHPDSQLVRLLDEQQITSAAFTATLLDRCAGVWLYLQYVLADIRAGRRSPTDVASLPVGLRTYYMQQIRERWAVDHHWKRLRRPTLALIAALQRPATATELAELACVDRDDVAAWLEGDLRAFLDVTRPWPRTYTMRHQSLRDLFTPTRTQVDHDDGGLGDELHYAILTAHSTLTDHFIPAGDPARRAWTDDYTRTHLPHHAAYAGRLDDLVQDPEFLLACQPDGILRHRHRLTTPAGTAAVDAYEQALDDINRYPEDAPTWWLHIWARKTRATTLADNAAHHTPRPWTIHTAMWTGTTHRTLALHTSTVLALAVLSLPDGRTLLASAGNDHTVQLWDPATGQPVPCLTGHTGTVTALAVLSLPDGPTLLASAGNDHTVRLWNPATGQPGPTLTGHTAPVNALAVLPLPDGPTLLASASDDHTVRLWDPATGQAGPTLTGHTDWVRALAILPLPDGPTLLASAGNDHTVRLWDPATGQAGLTLTGHTGWVTALAVLPLPDGRTLLASASADHTVRLWDPATGQPGPTLTGHTDWVRALAVLPLPDRPTLLASAGNDRTILVWAPDFE
ncbi:WD40 repeat domain-containing protein [Frankia canadensis]|uniref:WD40 repeat domain-containing protein n=1 Tax=Frankia canadensis TaxID=1836972 RepID=UPI0010549E98|nr:WD40 repeat domain-containing protein [Frankia canadensis]